MILRFKLLETTASISDKILSALLEDMVPVFQNISVYAQKNIREVVREGIQNSREYGSIMSGQLRLELGIPNSSQALENILSVWDQVIVSYNKPRISNKRIKGSIYLSMIRADYSDVLSVDLAQVLTAKSQSLPWLEWLLLMGDKVIIRDYSVSFESSPFSRTGGAVMRSSVNGRWSVPSEFAGVKNNNWITRTIESLEPNIDQALFRAMEQAV